MILQDILDQHLEEAVMLSSRRMRSVHNSLLKLSSLAQLDRRIDAHLDGLGVDGEHAWELCESVLKFDDAGEVFVVAHVALASAEAGRLQHVVEAAISSPEAVRGVVAALGWLSFTRVASVVESFASSSVPEQRCIAVAARSSHRVQGDWVQKALADEHPLVRARACRAVGELGRVELVNVLRANFTHADNAVAFWSCWSGALLGDMHALVALKQFASVPEFAERAIEVALRRTPGYAAGPWLEELSRDEANVRLVLRGAGIVGDPWFVPGLISMMNLPEMARLAFESFCTITGADPATTPLEAAAPLEFEEADAHPDDLLPWPDVPRVQAWWENNEGRFKSGNRYLLGKPATRDQVEWVLRYGSQLHRRGAALDLAMAAPGQPLFETRAPAARQQQLLGLN